MSPKTNQKNTPQATAGWVSPGRGGSLRAAVLLSQTIAHIVILRTTDGTLKVWELSRQAKKNNGVQLTTDVERERKMLTDCSWWSRGRARKRKRRMARGLRWIQTVSGSRWPFSALRMGRSSFTTGPLPAVSNAASAFWSPFSRFSAL